MFFFAPLVMAPAFYLMALYVLAAVVPALLLMRYVYRQDQIERDEALTGRVIQEHTELPALLFQRAAAQD